MTVLRFTRRLTLGAAAIAATCASCGIDTYSLDPGSIDAEPLRNWGDAVVELSSNQEFREGAPPGVFSTVGDRVEFPPDQVAAVCSLTNQLARSQMAIDLAHSHISFEFPAAPAKGTFSDGSAHLEIRSLSQTADLAHATIDHGATNVDVDDSHVTFGSHHVTVDFEGMSFDASTRVKIDLVFSGDDDSARRPHSSR
ncbi:MAG: hypothetical protein WBG86_16290 [Polyangiales bacterium]